ncbi:cysteine desulfurase family protein [Hymenobacter psychrophilus]|uniref:cysteine desulfurase n=1 Tax=Hymenobacter psychrophilus TaxID=651662 RepID=A0A1H3IRS3_9BACT|nr:cysteine desulfurase family protein [Hymenobacter psychrophilus]SDY29919.1 cysteine desulfurase [Hymenobacter psychrophilus]
MFPIYLDHHATTPCDPLVVDAMLPYFTEQFGNPSSPHFAGSRTADAVQLAREQVAQLVGAQPGEIIFTSGATEANNLALLGYARAARATSPRRRIVISAIEHKAISNPVKQLAREGFDIITLPVDAHGIVDLTAAAEAIDTNTLLVSVHAANGEVGTIQPIQQLSQLAHAAGALLHTDAAQAVGKIPLDVIAWGVDLLSLSGHKLYGPQGTGALVVRHPRRTQLQPLAWGGGQERGWRPGTLNVPGVVGLGAACARCAELLPGESARLTTLRDEFEATVLATVPTTYRNGHPLHRLPHNSSLTFPGLEADALLARLPTLALSTGSACDAGTIEPSATLLALGLSRDDARATVRIGVGRFNTTTELQLAASLLIRQVHTLSAVLGR